MTQSKLKEFVCKLTDGTYLQLQAKDIECIHKICNEQQYQIEWIRETKCGVCKTIWS